jgi:hypothetical protein
MPYSPCPGICFFSADPESRVIVPVNNKIRVNEYSCFESQFKYY